MFKILIRIILEVKMCFFKIQKLSKNFFLIKIHKKLKIFTLFFHCFFQNILKFYSKIVEKHLYQILANFLNVLGKSLISRLIIQNFPFL